MVSIPDWSRFSRIADAPKSGTMGSRYLKQREAEAIKQAEEQGYFLSPTRKILEQKFLPKETVLGPKSVLEGDEDRDLSAVTLVSLPNMHLRDVGDIGLCHNLTICILNNNFICSIDGLASCVNLIKLDLHSNQMKNLPSGDFWAQLWQLKILHLHDNPIGRIENLHHLAFSPQLAILTLADTPLSLKRNYRHHVVNSIWSLNALDDYVISDEEIIEDADFGGKFVAMHPSFKVDLCPKNSGSISYAEEFRLIHKVMSSVNKIMAHYSPVLLIQKMIRGFLVRKQFSFLQDARLCSRSASEIGDVGAAVTIQRQYREWKGTKLVEPQDQPTMASPIDYSSDAPSAGGVVDTIKMDYDSYLQNRRPGSTGASETSVATKEHKESVSPNRPHPTPASSANSHNRNRKNLFINLTKLHSGTLQSLQDEAIAIETVHTANLGILSDRSGQIEKRQRYRRRPKHVDKKRRIKSVKQFFGPVVDTVPTPEPQNEGDDDEIPVINFRLRGFKESIQILDPTADMILSRHEAGLEVRAAEAAYHHQTENRPKPVIKNIKKGMTKKQMLFARTQGTMGLACLNAVQKAYKDREKAEETAVRLEYVLSLREQRENSKERVHLFKQEKRQNVMKERDHDQKKVMEVLEKQEALNMNYVDQMRERKSKTSQMSRQYRSELTFMSDFGVQNTSVSNALMRHDRAAQMEDKMAHRIENVQALKTLENDQHDIVKKYLEHRQLMRQTESSMTRATLDTKMLQEANDRLLHARQRVAQKRACTSNIEHAVTPKPNANRDTLPPIDRAHTTADMEQWNNDLMITSGQMATRHATIAAM